MNFKYIIYIASILVFIFSCVEKKETIIVSGYDPEITPTVKTNNDTMYISDSGRIKYKIIAETMLMYDKANEPFTLFPDKAYMEQYDSLMNIVTTLRADSVWNYTKKKLWKLRGNVNIVTAKPESYDSEELFWDEIHDSVYSHVYVIINSPDLGKVKATGFESNRNFTKRTFRRVMDTDLYFSEEEDAKIEQDTVVSEK